MKILMLALFKHDADNPIRLAFAKDLSSFGFFTRSKAQECLHFAARTTVKCTDLRTRQTIALNESDLLAHSYVRADGLGAVSICDQEYPADVAFRLLCKIMDDFGSENEQAKEKQSWKSLAANGKDLDLASDSLTKDLAAFQNPQDADKLLKIQKQLDEVKTIMHKNIEEALKRGETLEHLMEKSNDLSDSSKSFYDLARRQNRCCKTF